MRGKRLFTDEEELEIERQYREEKVSTLTLGRRWSCGYGTINNVVKRVGGRLRNTKEAMNTDSCKNLSKQNNPTRTKGENNPNYKKGRVKANDGYIHILLGREAHPFSTNAGGSEYIYEHRLIMENFLKENDPNSKFLIDVDGFEGKWLNPKVITHHRNAIKGDNRIENLQLFESNKKHLSFHAKLRML